MYDVLIYWRNKEWKLKFKTQETAERAVFISDFITVPLALFGIRIGVLVAAYSYATDDIMVPAMRNTAKTLGITFVELLEDFAKSSTEAGFHEQAKHYLELRDEELKKEATKKPEPELSLWEPGWEHKDGSWRRNWTRA